MKVAAVVGTRPNFVKIAPVLAAMAAYPEIQPMLIHTGQHYDRSMSDSFFTQLEIPEPHVNLNVGSKSGASQTAEIMLRLAPVFATERPDLVLVVGDVNSTLAGALVAVKTGIAVAHVEAGLRSFDRTMPEEINRTLTDAVSDYCFTTEPVAIANLTREGIDPARIHHVGNVMIDTLFRFRERAAASLILRTLSLTPRAYAVLTLHRPSNVDNDDTLVTTLSAIGAIRNAMPVVFPVHPRTRERLYGLDDAHRSGLTLTDPLPYLDFVELMANARCVLTDSGGIQEETTALGVPCLTMRRSTERPITISQGTNRLVGTDADCIRAAWEQIQHGQWQTGTLPDLWDGKAAVRVVQILSGHGHH